MWLGGMYDLLSCFIINQVFSTTYQGSSQVFKQAPVE